MRSAQTEIALTKTQSKEVNACWSMVGQTVQKFSLLKFWPPEISLSWNFDLLKFRSIEILASCNFALLKFWPLEISASWNFSLMKIRTCGESQKSVPNEWGEREREVWRWVCSNDAKTSCIYNKNWGWIDVTVGLLNLHKFASRPWQFFHNKNKIIASFVHVGIRWSIDQSYTYLREESKKNSSCHK